MSEKSDKKSVTEDVVKKGQVKRLRILYESKCEDKNVFQRSKSESSTIDKYNEITSDLANYENINQRFIKKVSYSKSLTQTGLEKGYTSYNELRKFENGNLADRKLIRGNIHSTVENYQSNENITLENTQNVQLNTNKTCFKKRAGDVTSMPKRPLPSPRAHTLSRKEHRNKTDILQRSSSLRSNKKILNTFIEADKLGNIEHFRKSLLDMIDEKMNEMKFNGYDDNESDNGENIISDEESSDESHKNGSDSDLGDPSEEELVNQPSYVNLIELLGCKIKEEIEKPNPLQVNGDFRNEIIEHPIYENVEEHILNNFDVRGRIDEAMNWNIPPVPDRSLKPATKLDHIKKNVIFNDETDDENYELIDEYIVKMKAKVEMNHETWENKQLETENRINTQSPKLSKIVQEFKETEIRYIKELKEIVPVYKYGIKNHSSLVIRSKMGLICATIDKLLEIQSEFARMIEKSDDSIETILQNFIEFEELFITYKQCLGTNDPITITLGYIENDLKKEINLPSLLSQRLVHYQMFLERIRNEVSKQQDTQILQVVLCSLNTVIEILNSCNTMLLLATVENIPLKTNKFGSLNDVREAPSSLFVQCCPLDVSGYGVFLIKDRFKIRKPFSMELNVFLFNNILLFTMEKENERYYYHSHIKMNDIILRPLNKRDILELQHFRKSKQFHSPTNYKLKADPKIVAKWRKNINDCLRTQKLLVNEEVTVTNNNTFSKFYVK